MEGGGMPNGNLGMDKLEEEGKKLVFEVE